MNVLEKVELLLILLFFLIIRLVIRNDNEFEIFEVLE